MEQQAVLDFLQQHGIWFIFAASFLEHCNLPGFPAGVVYPAAGFWASRMTDSFWAAYGLSVLGGALGSFVTYLAGYFGGTPLLRWLCGRSQRLTALLERNIEGLRRQANRTVFVAKLLPVVRTLIGFPAGALRMPCGSFLLSSTLGLGIFHLLLMASGYWLGGMLG